MPTSGSGISPRSGVFQIRIWKTLHRAVTARGGGSAAGAGDVLCCCLQQCFVTRFPHALTSPPLHFVTSRHHAKRGGKVRNRPRADTRCPNLNGSSPTDSGYAVYKNSYPPHRVAPPTWPPTHRDADPLPTPVVAPSKPSSTASSSSTWRPTPSLSFCPRQLPEIPGFRVPSPPASSQYQYVAVGDDNVVP